MLTFHMQPEVLNVSTAMHTASEFQYKFCLDSHLKWYPPLGPSMGGGGVFISIKASRQYFSNNSCGFTTQHSGINTILLSCTPPLGTNNCSLKSFLMFLLRFILSLLRLLHLRGLCSHLFPKSSFDYLAHIGDGWTGIEHAIHPKCNMAYSDNLNAIPYCTCIFGFILLLHCTCMYTYKL